MATRHTSTKKSATKTTRPAARPAKRTATASSAARPVASLTGIRKTTPKARKLTKHALSRRMLPPTASTNDNVGAKVIPFRGFTTPWSHNAPKVYGQPSRGYVRVIAALKHARGK